VRPGFWARETWTVRSGTIDMYCHVMDPFSARNRGQKCQILCVETRQIDSRSHKTQQGHFGALWGPISHPDSFQHSVWVPGRGKCAKIEFISGLHWHAGLSNAFQHGTSLDLSAGQMRSGLAEQPYHCSEGPASGQYGPDGTRRALPASAKRTAAIYGLSCRITCKAAQRRTRTKLAPAPRENARSAAAAARG
jgi:hypothetical protein